MRERFDLATARALAPLAVACELTLPFLRVGGRAVLLKGPSARAELRDGRAASAILGGSDPQLIEATLAGGERRIVVAVTKLEPTPAEFPRRPGVPRHRPLKG